MHFWKNLAPIVASTELDSSRVKVASSKAPLRTSATWDCWSGVRLLFPAKETVTLSWPEVISLLIDTELSRPISPEIVLAMDSLSYPVPSTV